MKSVVFLLSAACFTGYFLSLHAQPGDKPGKIESRHFYMKDGLPDEAVSAIVQDKYGFLWMSTYSGLVKFDGYKFITFESNPFSANSLRNNGLNCLWMDKQGRLWIGHEEGLDIFDPATEKFLFHWNDSLNNSKGINIRVTKIRQRHDDSLWICTNQGLYVADADDLRLRKYDHLPSDLIYRDIIEMPDHSLWISTTSKLLHFVPGTKQLTTYEHDPDNDSTLSNNHVKSVYFDKDGRMWVGTFRGLNLFNPDTRSFKRYFPRLDILSFFENTDGKLWLGSEYGVLEFDRETENTNRITDFYYTLQIFKDQQGIIWLATLHGLHQINPKFKKFNIYPQFNNNIGYIVEDKNKDIWMSTFRGVFRFDHEFKNAYQHSRVGRALSNLTHSIYEHADGSLWFASTGKIERFDLDNQTSDSVSIPPNIRPMSLLVDSNGKIWVGGGDHMANVDPVTKQYSELSSFPKAGVHFILEDSHKNIWAGTSAGLVRFNINTRKLYIFKNDPKDPHSLSNNTVYHILIDTKGAMWIATDGGLNKILPGTENTLPRFTHWRTSNSGLPNNNVYTILDGKDGTLWLASGNMISHFYPQENIFRNYDDQDGLPGRDIKEGWYHGRGLRSSIGQLYFGTGWGVVVFHPDSLEENKFVPPIAITGFSIHNQPVPISGTDGDTLKWSSALSKTISQTTEINLAYDQNDFNVEFSALNFVNPQNNRYKYRLEPYESNWIERQASQRVAHYTNISPGVYKFRVIGSNNDGVWNEAGATLTITITPPWWRTWWAYSLYFVAFIALILSWRNYDLKRAKLKHRAEHLSELDHLKSRFFTNISHEFRTPITLILGPLKDLYNGRSKEDPKAVLGPVIRNGERLHRLINQLLDLSKIEAGRMKLHASPTELVEFLRGIAASYESLAKEKNIRYIFFPEVEQVPVYFDAEKIEKVVHNILSNAFKFTNPGGDILLFLKAENNHALISVKDTGIGIPADKLEKVFDRFYQVDSSHTRGYEGSGIGMALARELVELHKGKISVQSIEGRGTTFTVTLPLGKDHLNKEDITEIQYTSEKQMLSDIVVSGENNGEGEEEKASASAFDQPVVLIVEDNADMRNYIRKTLSTQYQIVEAENGKEGVKKAEETVPDLIISDIMMPEMDGYRLCELIKTNEVTSHIPVILLTAKADRESKIAGLTTGADDYLSKPFDGEELKLIIRNRIEQRRTMRERFSREITLEPRQISITSLDEQFIAKVLGIIEAHMDDEAFSIDALSREAGFSNMHFYRKIKALTGQTPSQFLRTIRLKRAAELLARNSDNVTQIAYSVGFNSLSYFNKCFKEQFGVTPGQFAEKSKV